MGVVPNSAQHAETNNHRTRLNKMRRVNVLTPYAHLVISRSRPKRLVEGGLLIPALVAGAAFPHQISISSYPSI